MSSSHAPADRSWLDARGASPGDPRLAQTNRFAPSSRASRRRSTVPASVELTAVELDVLRAGGVDLDRAVTRDPFESTVVLFAALIESSLSTTEAAERLGVATSQVRQMIARRTLYSVKLDERRYVPRFQFRRDGALVPNITRVNPAVPSDLHPVEVYEWYTLPEPDLAIDDGEERRAISPLDWLDTGGSPARVTALARRL